MQKYTEVEYININGGSTYFDTGVNITEDLVCKVKLHTYSSSWGLLIGNLKSGNSDSYWLRVPQGYTKFENAYLGSGVWSNNSIDFDSTYDIEFGDLYIIVDGVKTEGIKKTISDTTRTLQIGTSHSSSINCDYYSVKLYKGEELVADYIPCLDSTNKAAFYDKVSDSFIYATGSGIITPKLFPKKYNYNFLGGQNVVLLPSHQTDAEESVLYSSITVKSIPFTFDTATTTDVHIRCKICPYTIQNPNETVGFGYENDNNDWRLFAYYDTACYLDIGSARAQVSPYGYKCGTVEIEIGNNYIKDIPTDTYTYQGIKQSVTYEITDGKGHFDIGALYVVYAQVLDDNDNLLLDLVPKKDSNGNACLYDKLTDTYYGADWLMTYDKKGTTVSNWKNCCSVDFGGCDVTFSGDAESWEGNTNISAITNGNIMNENDTSYNSNPHYTFQNCTNLKEFNCKLDNIKHGTLMFHGCSNLKDWNVDLPELIEQTHKGNSASQYWGMFGECSNLESFVADLGKLSDGTGMFRGCTKLKTFKSVLPKLTDGSVMFRGCTSLENWDKDLSYMTDGEGMFYKCSSLKNFTGNLDKLENGGNGSSSEDDGMFFGCTSLQTFTTQITSLKYAKNMFYGCTSLTDANLGNTDKLSETLHMFNDCSKLTSVTMSLSSVTSWNDMFSGCTALIDWNIKDLGIECSTLLKTNVTSFDYIADNAKSVTNGEWFVMTDDQYSNYPSAVTTLQDKGWNVYKESNYPQDRTEGTNQVLMSNGSLSICGNTYSNELEGIDKWLTLPDSANTWTSMNNVFRDNQVIKKVYVDLNSCTQAGSMCIYCKSLTYFSGDFSTLTDGNYAFAYCYALKSLNINLPSLTNGQYMFSTCSGLTEWNIELPSLTNGSYMFSLCLGLTEWNIDLPSITNGRNMFYTSTHLTSFSSNMSKLTNGYQMFYRCINLQNFDGNLDSVAEASYMFYECSSLTSFTTNSLSSVTNSLCMFQSTSLPSFSADMNNTANIRGLFCGDNALTTVTLSAPVAKQGREAFWNCTSLQTAYVNMPSMPTGSNGIERMFYGDTALTDVQLIVSNSLSSQTASAFGIAGCPATAYTYCDVVDENSVKLTFTATERVTS